MIRAFKITLLSLVCMAPAFAGLFSIPEENLFVPQSVGKRVSVNFEEGRFSAFVDGRTYQIKPHDVVGLPSTLTEDQLKKFLNHGYLLVKETGEEYRIEGIVRGLGGMDQEDPTSCWKALVAGTVGGGVAGSIVPGLGTLVGAGVGGAAATGGCLYGFYKGFTWPKKK